MLGAIAGDILGSVYNGNKAWLRERTLRFDPLFAPDACFTDDTVLIVAVADSILHGIAPVSLLEESAWDGADDIRKLARDVLAARR